MLFSAFDAILQAVGPGQQCVVNAYQLYATGVSAPTQTELDNFLQNLLIPSVSAENRKNGTPKLNRANVANALQLIQQSNVQAFNPAFPNIAKQLFLFQLAMHVRRPRLIAQGEHNLCGPNSLIIDYAKSDPVGFVTYALDLYRTGQGNFKQHLVTPSDQIKYGVPNHGTAEADYVVLASMRNAAYTWINSVNLVLELTKPGMLCAWLTDAGYAQVRDHTMLNMSTSATLLNAVTGGSLHGSVASPLGANSTSTSGLLHNLQHMANDLAQNRVVIMLADVNLAGLIHTGQQLTARTDPVGARETHWTLVRRIAFNQAADTIDIKYYSWGHARTTQQPLHAFLSRYCGFVSARP